MFFPRVILVLLLFFNPAFQHQETVNDKNNLTVNVDQGQRVTLVAQSSLQVQLRNIPQYMTFVIFQVHMQHINVTLSAHPHPAEGSSVSGNHVGMIYILELRQTQALWFITAEYNGTALVKAMWFNETDPLPGGCSMEFPLKFDPSLHLLETNQQSVVQFQYANLGFRRGAKPRNCEKTQNQKQLRYDVYQFYFTERDVSEDHFLDTMESLMDLEYLDKFATKVTVIQHGERTNVSFAAYSGQGVAYVVLVTQTRGGKLTRAMYIPTVTYSCTWDGNKCLEDNMVAAKVICTLLAVIGLFICFFGHTFFKFEQFVFGFLAFVLVFYIVLKISTVWTTTVILVVCLPLGIVGGILWLCVWVFLAVPVVSVLLVGIVLGYLASSTAFNLTPLGNLSIWHTPFNYGTAFSCGILLLPVILLVFTKKLNIIGTAVVGSHLTIFATDLYLKGTLRLIIINSAAKATIPGFLNALATVPFQTSDIVLSVLWVILAVSGIVYQMWSSHGKPDFPPHPWKAYQSSRQRMLAVQYGQDGEDTDSSVVDTRKLITDSNPVVDPM